MSGITHEKLLRRLVLKIQPNGSPEEFAELMGQLSETGALMLDESEVLAMYRRKPPTVAGESRPGALNDLAGALDTLEQKRRLK